MVNVALKDGPLQARQILFYFLSLNFFYLSSSLGCCCKTWGWMNMKKRCQIENSFAIKATKFQKTWSFSVQHHVDATLSDQTLPLISKIWNFHSQELNLCSVLCRSLDVEPKMKQGFSGFVTFNTLNILLLLHQISLRVKRNWNTDQLLKKNTSLLFFHNDNYEVPTP